MTIFGHTKDEKVMSTPQIEILENAELQGLSKIEITHSSNGYPQGLGDFGVTGFSTFKDAEGFAAKIGGEVVNFESRDGWHFWLNKGIAYKPYTCDDLLSDLGDNYSYADTDTEYYREQLMDSANDFDGDFTDLESIIKNIKEIQTAVEEAGSDEIVVTYSGKYYDTVKKEMIAYSEDTHRYAIGVFVRRDEKPIEEEDEA